MKYKNSLVKYLYALPERKMNGLSSTMVLPPNRNCECVYNPSNSVTSQRILNGTDLKINSTHTLNGIGDRMKNTVRVAFNVSGKCVICSHHFTEEKVVVLEYKQATSNDCFKALIKGKNINGLPPRCSDPPFNITFRQKRLIKTNNMPVRYYQRIKNDENDEDVESSDTSGFTTKSATTIIPVKVREFPNVAVEGNENISTCNSFPADIDEASEMNYITIQSRSNVLVGEVNYTYSPVESENTYAVDISQSEPIACFNNILLDLNGCSDNPCIENGNKPSDNILNSPGNISQPYHECDNETYSKHIVDYEGEKTQLSVAAKESFYTSSVNTTENDRLIPEEQDSFCSLRNPSIDEEKYILVSGSTSSSPRDEKDHLIHKEHDTRSFVKSSNPPNIEERYSYISVSNDENDCLLPKEKVIGSVNDLLDSPMIEERLLMDNEYSISYESIDNIPHQIQRSRTSSIDSNGDHCRVCHCHGDEVLISPCHCNGSLKYVHETCLITWMKNPFKDACEICKKKILIVKKRKPIYTWRWPIQRPTPLVWVIVFTTAICVNLMSVVKDATRKCVTTSCIIFYVIGSVGIILASMFLYFWVKRVKVFCESWKVQNEHWVVKVEDDPGKIV